MAAASACSPTSAASPRPRKPWTMAPRAWACCARSFCSSAAPPRPSEEEQVAAYRAIAAVAGRAAADRPHARCRRRQEPALRGDRRGGEPVPRLARHPRDLGPPRPVPDAAPRHPARRRGPPGGAAAADGLVARRVARGEGHDPGNRGGARTRRCGLPAEHPGRRHDRSARGGGHRPRAGARRELLQHRQQRSDPVLMAADRTNARVAPLADAFSPPFCA